MAPWWNLWIPVVSGAVGGAIALLGQGLAQVLTAWRDERNRKNEAKARELAELKGLYVAYLSELNVKTRRTSEIITRKHASQLDIQEFIKEQVLLGTTDIYFRLRMLEKDPKGEEWIKDIGEADRSILALMTAPLVNQEYFFNQANPVFDKIYRFQEWIYTERFR